MRTMTFKKGLEFMRNNPGTKLKTCSGVIWEFGRVWVDENNKYQDIFLSNGKPVNKQTLQILTENVVESLLTFIKENSQFTTTVYKIFDGDYVISVPEYFEASDAVKVTIEPIV
jgi:hypothetical protein